MKHIEIDYINILEKVYRHVLERENKGNVADYIPELKTISPDHFAVYIHALDGQKGGFGDCQVKFSIQSIAKVLLLSKVYQALGPSIWKRVGVEPAGTPFNSLVQLEYDLGIPRNPMINAGAIVICDILLSMCRDPKKEILDYVRKVAQNDEIDFNEKVACSELSVGYRNVALIHLMKAFKNIENDIDEVLDFYFHLCSIEMTCEELSRSFLFFANDGTDPFTNEPFLSLSRSKRINAVMQTCGFYDEAGEFSFKVGLPGKSGVGGGIVAIHPEYFSVSVWSPRLNKKGNSYRGLQFLEMFTTETGQSVF